MIEKIFIPTVTRMDNQITYDNLPDELKKRVVFVVQKWEREKYNFDADYMVLPDYITLEHPRAIAETRKLIYEEGKNIKYAVLDDDITFNRRNAKYWTGTSNMEKSKRKCDLSDILEMFELYSNWLDEPSVTVCGCSHVQNPPDSSAYSNNSSIASTYWINGPDFADILSDLKLTEVKIAEDILFILSLLSRGYGNRVSQEFCFSNNSILNKKIKSEIWDKQTQEATLRDHQTIARMFPGIFEVLYEGNNPTMGNIKRKEGGFRNSGKFKCYWSKAFNSHTENTLENFLND